jgi:Pentapeptide repeats (8 copies)
MEGYLIFSDANVQSIIHDYSNLKPVVADLTNVDLWEANITEANLHFSLMVYKPRYISKAIPNINPIFLGD